jgi:hypothetical protein
VPLVKNLERRLPDLAGPAGEAWELPVKKGRLSFWLVQCPDAHPFWKWWVVTLAVFRELPIAPGTRRLYPQAEYEFAIGAIDPYLCPAPDPAKAEQEYPELVPLDVVKQFHGITDEQATELCKTSVQGIVGGLLSPDDDQRGKWAPAIDTMVKELRSRPRGK